LTHENFAQFRIEFPAKIHRDTRQSSQLIDATFKSGIPAHANAGTAYAAPFIGQLTARISWALLSKGEAYRGASAGGGGRLRMIPLDPAREITG
jgi:hypothetical protein